MRHDSEFIISRMKIRLHVLSPVHIGCGEVYEPTSFVIDPDKNVLISFDPIEFIRLLDRNEKSELMKITSKGTISSIIELYRFISNKRHKIKGREILAAGDIVKRYSEVKALRINNERQLKQELNKFEINRTAFNPADNKPYIPGSSLKGALRTGYLSMLACAGGDTEELHRFVFDPDYKPLHPVVEKKKASALETELLGGSFNNDPFRFIKVSDLLPVNGSIRTQILYAINWKKDSDKQGRGPSQIFEVLLQGSVFEGNLTIQQPLKESKIASPIEQNLFLRSVHKHYARVYKKEKEVVEKRGFKMPKLGKFSERQKKDIFLVRVGRHSGAEAVTIEGNRNIRIMQKRGMPSMHLDHATTIWLASDKSRPVNSKDLLPLGWVVLEVV
jgi:CRISPR-associated protein Csm5